MIYFDNSATTPPCPAAVKAAAEASFANPSSRHFMGVAAAKELENARECVADVLKVAPRDLYFTSGGTAADNIAILGGADLHRGRRIVTTAVEHPAVLECVRELSARGFEVVHIPASSRGDITPEDIEAALTPDTGLVSIMHVNNETGAIFPVDKIKPIMQKICPDALLHTDAVQSFGKIAIHPEKCGVDMLSASAHKIHGIKGAGALYVRRGINLKTPVLGGGQESGIVSGTHNLPAIAAFAAATKEIDFGYENLPAKKLLAALSEIKGVTINRPQNALDSIINLSFGNIPSEVTLNALSAEGLCISAGSACSSSKAGKSHVLRAMGAKNAAGAVRFSLSRYNTSEEVDEALSIINKTIIPLMEALA